MVGGRKASRTTTTADRDASPVRNTSAKYDWVVFFITAEELEEARTIAVPQQAFFEGFVEWAEEFANGSDIFAPQFEPDELDEHSSATARSEVALFDRLGVWGPSHTPDSGTWERYVTDWHDSPRVFKGNTLIITCLDFLVNQFSHCP